MSFQRMILTLHDYWSERGCVILQPYDMEMGAGTFHPRPRCARWGRTAGTPPSSSRAAVRPMAAMARIPTGSSIITSIR